MEADQPAEVVAARVTPLTCHLIRAAATKSGATVSAWLRAVAREQAERELGVHGWQELTEGVASGAAPDANRRAHRSPRASDGPS